MYNTNWWVVLRTIVQHTVVHWQLYEEYSYLVADE
jgi:hypothetical protein